MSREHAACESTGAPRQFMVNEKIWNFLGAPLEQDNQFHVIVLNNNGKRTTTKREMKTVFE